MFSGSNGPKEAQKPNQMGLGQGLAPCLDIRSARIAHTPKLGAVGALGWPADHPGRPTRPWAPPPQPAPWKHVIGPQRQFQLQELHSTGRRRVTPPYIYERGGRITTHLTLELHLFLFHLELVILHPRCIRQPRSVGE